MAERATRAQVELERFMSGANLSAFTTVVQSAFFVRSVRDLGALTDSQLVSGRFTMFRSLSVCTHRAGARAARVTRVTCGCVCTV
jgi:hypothetical protein